MSIEAFADVLIASRCGTHSLGLVYEFLLKVHRNPRWARADFVRYLSGELSPLLLREAVLWVSEEQGRLASMDKDEMAPELSADLSWADQVAGLTHYEVTQASL